MIDVADSGLHERSAAIARHDEHAVVLVGQFPRQGVFSGTLANDKNAHGDHRKTEREGANQE